MLSARSQPLCLWPCMHAGGFSCGRDRTYRRNAGSVGDSKNAGARAGIEQASETIFQIATFGNDTANSLPLAIVRHQMIDLVELVGGDELQYFQVDLATGPARQRAAWLDVLGRRDPG